MRFAEAKPYDAKGHFGMLGLRLFPPDDAPSESKNITCGVSHFLPGGGAQSAASDSERFYFLLSGELTLEANESTYVLRANDSCLIPAGELRSLVNHSNHVATLLVVIVGPRT